MKIKTDFVTNSSSTNYVVFIPKNFKTTEEELRNLLDYMKDDGILLDSAMVGIDAIKNGHTIWHEDINSDSFYALKYLLDKRDLIIARVDMGSDGMDTITGIKSEVIKKAFLLTCDLKEIKEIIDR